MRLTDFETLSFGCYGTLIDRDSGIYAALRPLLAAGNVTLQRQDVLAIFTRFETAQQAKTPAMRYSEVLAQVHRSLAKEWGVLLSDDTHALFGKSVAHVDLLLLGNVEVDVDRINLDNGSELGRS